MINMPSAPIDWTVQLRKNSVVKDYDDEPMSRKMAQT